MCFDFFFSTVVGRRTKEEIRKSRIKLTALRFQIRGRHQNLRPPFGDFQGKNDDDDDAREEI